MAKESVSSDAARDVLLRRMANEARGLKQAATQFGNAVEAMAMAVKESAAGAAGKISPAKLPAKKAV